MTAWLLQAVVLPPLSIKPKDLKSKPQFEFKRKKKKNKNRTICDKRKGWRSPFDRPQENILYRVGRCLPNVGVRLTYLEDTHVLWRNIWVVFFSFIILIIIIAIMLYLQTLRMFSISIWFSACTTNFQAVVNLIASEKAGNGKFGKPGFSDWKASVIGEY